MSASESEADLPHLGRAFHALHHCLDCTHVRQFASCLDDLALSPSDGGNVAQIIDLSSACACHQWWSLRRRAISLPHRILSGYGEVRDALAHFYQPELH